MVIDIETLLTLGALGALVRAVRRRRRRSHVGGRPSDSHGPWDPPAPAPEPPSAPMRDDWDTIRRTAQPPPPAKPRAEDNEERLEAARSLHSLLALSPSDFEECVASIFRRLGWRDLRRVGGPGDVAADLIGTDPDGRRTVVQCKRFDHTAVGSPVVQTVLAMAHLHHSAERAVVVTTSRFTKDARRLAKLHEVELIDGKSLLALARRADPATAKHSGQPLAITSAEQLSPIRVRLTCRHVTEIQFLPSEAIGQSVTCDWCGAQSVAAVLDG